MCLTTNAIEQQALSICEEIRNHSNYKLVRLNFIGDQGLEVKNNSFSIPEDRLPLVSNVVLEDSDGKTYKIEPNENGLRFAKGEITYNEYLRIKKKAGRQVTGIFFGTIGGFVLMSFALFKILI